MSMKVVDMNDYKRSVQVGASNGGYIKDCIVCEEEGNPITGYNWRGDKVFTIDGYAIIPRKRYNELLIRSVMYRSWFDKLKLKIASWL